MHSKVTNGSSCLAHSSGNHCCGIFFKLSALQHLYCRFCFSTYTNGPVQLATDLSAGCGCRRQAGRQLVLGVLMISFLMKLWLR